MCFLLPPPHSQGLGLSIVLMTENRSISTLKFHEYDKYETVLCEGSCLLWFQKMCAPLLGLVSIPLCSSLQALSKASVSMGTWALLFYRLTLGRESGLARQMVPSQSSCVGLTQSVGGVSLPAAAAASWGSPGGGGGWGLAQAGGLASPPDRLLLADQVRLHLLPGGAHCLPGGAADLLHPLHLHPEPHPGACLCLPRSPPLHLRECWGGGASGPPSAPLLTCQKRSWRPPAPGLCVLAGLGWAEAWRWGRA